MVRVLIKRQFCNYSSCKILQFLEQVATQTVPNLANRAAIIEIWYNQSVIRDYALLFIKIRPSTLSAPIPPGLKSAVS